MTERELLGYLKKKIDNLSGPEIKAAVKEYLERHPDAAMDILGLYKDADGDICQKEE